jgi:L-iditol 2-dehydrogenase
MPPLGKGDVLIKVEACGICGSDIHYLRGNNPWSLHTLGIDERMPSNVILGHEVAGSIVRPGPSPLGVGARVGVIAFESCGKCTYCLSGRHNLCSEMLHIGHDGRWGPMAYTPGGMAEFCPVWADKVRRLPDVISCEEATQLDGLAVAVHAVNRAAHALSNVLVFGAGPIGLMALQVAKVKGAERVVCVDRWDKPLEVALQLGADAAERYAGGGPSQGTLAPTGGQGFDAVLDTVGSAETIDWGIRALRRAGSLVLLAGFVDKATLELRFLSGERSITSSCNNLYHEYDEALQLLAQGEIRVRPFITHRFRLEEVEEAFRVAANKEEHDAIKVIVLP